jgi:sulfite oxidase
LYCYDRFTHTVQLSRRHFLLLTAGAVVQPGFDRPKRDMIVRSSRPEDLEMPLAGFSDYITPVDRFFVRSHVYVPGVDVGGWRLTVDGEVTKPLTLTMADIRRMPAVELVSVLECAGNGRGFYEPSMPGLQWMHGAVGNGRWRGVRLADVLRQAGLTASGRHVLFGGADVPLGTMPDFARSIPIPKALQPHTLLAYEMNGETLPVKHGFPLRVVVPGWAGDAWMKWVTSISVLDREPDSFWMARAYRHPGHAVQPGAAVPPETMEPVTNLRVKSVIAAPRDGSHVAIGRPLSIAGAAWSGETGPVVAVDVSVDSGRSWKPATIRRERTEFGWRLWSYEWTPARAAYYTLLARARDAAGNMQPLEQEWNPSGYGWNVVHRVGVNAAAAPRADTPRADAPRTADAPPVAFTSSCVVCHEDDVVRQQRLTRAQWDAEINKMMAWGAKVRDEDRQTLLDYLVRSYGAQARF